MAKYPEHIMDRVRQRLGLEEGDTSKDFKIDTMNHLTVLDHCLCWEGIIGYNNTILDWIDNIYGVKLK